MKKSLTYLLIILLAFASWANAIDVTLGWDASNDPAPAGYGVHWDTVNQIPFNNTADVSTGTQHTITGLAENTTYYFAVDAYDAEGNRSVYSNILEYIVRAERVIIRVMDRPNKIKIIWE